MINLDLRYPVGFPGLGADLINTCGVKKKKKKVLLVAECP